MVGNSGKELEKTKNTALQVRFFQFHLCFNFLIVSITYSAGTLISPSVIFGSALFALLTRFFSSEKVYSFVFTASDIKRIFPAISILLSCLYKLLKSPMFSCTMRAL